MTAAGTECVAHIQPLMRMMTRVHLNNYSEEVVDVFAFLGAGETTMPARLALSGRRKFFNLVLS